MKSIQQLRQEIAEYDDVAVGAAQVLGSDWDYEITSCGEVLILAYTGPAVQRSEGMPTG